MQATGQASTQSATPSQISVTIECGIVVSVGMFKGSSVNAFFSSLAKNTQLFN